MDFLGLAGEKPMMPAPPKVRLARLALVASPEIPVGAVPEEELPAAPVAPELPVPLVVPDEPPELSDEPDAPAAGV